MNFEVGNTCRWSNIDWRVLAVENNKALIISEEILEKRPYNAGSENVTWETCTLRQYLNGEFYDKLGADKSAIAETHNANPNNPWFDAAGGNATADKVFLLSLDELVKHFGDSGVLRNWNKKDWIFNDQYNSARIAKYESERAWWWLRSPGSCSEEVANVDFDGTVYVIGTLANVGKGGVRPALWLNL